MVCMAFGDQKYSIYLQSLLESLFWVLYFKTDAKDDQV